MELKEILVRANTAVAEADIPEELREIAFAKAVDLLSSQSGAHPTAASGSPITPRDDASATESQNPLGRVAERLGLDETRLSEVLFFDPDGAVEVLVSTNSLDSSNAGATRELALLIVGARQLSGIEEWTSVDHVRGACEHFGRYDADNFASTIKRTDAYFSMRGKVRERMLKLRKPGEEALTRLLERFQQGGNSA